MTEHSHCDEVRLDPYGEQWGPGLRAHVDECSGCGIFLRTITALRSRLRSPRASAEAMPAQLRAALLGQLDEAAAPPAPVARLPRRNRWFVPAAMAASLVLGVFLGRGLDLAGGGAMPNEVHRTIGMYIEDVTHDHYLIERIGRPLEVALTDRGELSQWLTESLSFAFEVPGTGRDFALQGGRVWHTVGRLSAMAAFATPDGGRAILFAVPAENLELAGAEETTVGGVTVFSGRGWENEARVWIDGDLALALVAPEGRLPASWADDFLP
jgi:anti-sigma factor RsiW